MQAISGTTGEIRLTKQQFLKLPDPEKRIALAKDVLTYVDLRMLRPKTGRYFHPVSTIEFKLDQDIRDVVKISNCYVCAIGALFVAAIMYHQECRYTSAEVDSYCMRRRLKDYFSPEQLALIEICFEGSSAFSNANQKSDEVVAAMTFGEDLRRYPNEVMTAIMNNIILNKGLFDPTQEAIV